MKNNSRKIMQVEVRAGTGREHFVNYQERQTKEALEGMRRKGTLEHRHPRTSLHNVPVPGWVHKGIDRVLPCVSGLVHKQGSKERIICSESSGRITGVYSGKSFLRAPSWNMVLCRLS